MAEASLWTVSIPQWRELVHLISHLEDIWKIHAEVIKSHHLIHVLEHLPRRYSSHRVVHHLVHEPSLPVHSFIHGTLHLLHPRLMLCKAWQSIPEVVYRFVHHLPMVSHDFVQSTKANIQAIAASEAIKEAFENRVVLPS